MDRERVDVPWAAQTVVVRGDRIVAIGATTDTAVPDEATIIDGTGRYLLPGLVDGHVHLLGFGPGPRENFADGPVYLANGITTVVNMGGPSSPRRATELEWKRRVEAGGPGRPAPSTGGAVREEPGGPAPVQI